MKLLIISKLHVGESAETALTRYLESPDRNPPPGVKRLGRWFSASFDTSYVFVETPDLALLSGWLRQWTEHGAHEIIPVLDDADLAKTLPDK
ncbi:MAG: DUF3303 domain-containing protein [Nevskiales bacterium]